MSIDSIPLGIDNSWGFSYGRSGGVRVAWGVPFSTWTRIGTKWLRFAKLRCMWYQTIEGGWRDTVVARGINWERMRRGLFCADCNKLIESAYGGGE